MTRLAIALVAVVICGVAWADVEADADRAFQAAQRTASIEGFEALGAVRPTTRWTDDAWAEAARLAERAGDFARARRALEQVIALGTDDQLVRRARASLARLDAVTGAGRWDAVRREHERLVADAFDGDDPRAELAALEALLAANPDYPRANDIRRAIARGWEQEGDTARALTWLRSAANRDGPDQHARLELVRALLRADQLAAAAAEIEILAASPQVDRAVLDDVRDALGIAERRATTTRVMWIVLALLAVIAGIVLRRDTGSWRAAGKRLVRPPIEVVFLLPVAIVLGAFALTGNPLVAASVRFIVIAGIMITWISGALLQAARARGGLRGRRVLVHVLAAVIAGGAATYIAVNRGRVIDFVVETWRTGHQLR